MSVVRSRVQYFRHFDSLFFFLWQWNLTFYWQKMNKMQEIYLCLRIPISFSCNVIVLTMSRQWNYWIYYIHIWDHQGFCFLNRNLRYFIVTYVINSSYRSSDLRTFISGTVRFVHISWKAEVVLVESLIYVDLSWWLYIPSLNPYTLRYLFSSQSMLSNFIPQNSALNTISLFAILLEQIGPCLVGWNIYTSLLQKFLWNARFDVRHATGTVWVNSISTYSPSITVNSYFSGYNKNKPCIQSNPITFCRVYLN